MNGYFNLSNSSSDLQASVPILLTASGWSDPSVGQWFPGQVPKKATLTKDINQAIVVEIDNVVLDGQNHTITASPNPAPSSPVVHGIALTGRSNITVQNFTIQNSTNGIFIGLGTNPISNITVNNCSLYNNQIGISIINKSNNTISNCKTENSRSSGISLQSSSENTIENFISINDQKSFSISNSANTNNKNIIKNCDLSRTLAGTTTWAIYLSNSSLNTISNCKINGFTRGIYCYNNSGNNSIKGCIISNNNEGISVNNSSANIVDSCIFSSNNNAIFGAVNMTNTTVINNSLNSNIKALYLAFGCNQNTIYNNNFINNTTQAECYGSNNIFNQPASLGGNYWSNWSSPDDDYNGFVDIKYNFPNADDNMPWTVKGGWLAPITTCSLTGILGSNGWYMSEVSVNLEAEESHYGTGIGGIEYSYNKSDWFTYSLPLYIVDEGDSIIYYRSKINDVTNSAVEPIKRVMFKIDKTAPEVVINSPVDGARYKLNSEIPVNWNATDSLSQIDTVEATLPNGSNIDTGSIGIKSFSVIAVDKAGNRIIKEASYLVYEEIPERKLYFS